jgi:hypothetical protein
MQKKKKTRGESMKLGWLRKRWKKKRLDKNMNSSSYWQNRNKTLLG